MSYYYTPIRMAKIKNKNKIRNIQSHNFKYLLCFADSNFNLPFRPPPQHPVFNFLLEII